MTPVEAVQRAINEHIARNPVPMVDAEYIEVLEGVRRLVHGATLPEEYKHEPGPVQPARPCIHNRYLDCPDCIEEARIRGDLRQPEVPGLSPTQIDAACAEYVRIRDIQQPHAPHGPAELHRGVCECFDAWRLAFLHVGVSL